MLLFIDEFHRFNIIRDYLTVNDIQKLYKVHLISLEIRYTTLYR